MNLDNGSILSMDQGILGILVLGGQGSLPYRVLSIDVTQPPFNLYAASGYLNHHHILVDVVYT